MKDIEAETRTLAKQLASDGADNPIVRTLATMAAVHHTRWSLAITRSTVNRRTLAEEDRFARLAEREGRAFMRTVKLLNAIQKNQPETLQQIFAQFNVGSPDR